MCLTYCGTVHEHLTKERDGGIHMFEIYACIVMDALPSDTLNVTSSALSFCLAF